MGLEKVIVKGIDEKYAAYFRGMILQKAKFYFPRIEQWCPPIYLGINPSVSSTKSHISADASYIYIAQADVAEGDNDIIAQMELLYHELAHVVEVKFMGRTVETCDESFAWAVQDAVKRGDKLVYVVLTQIMEGRK